MSFMSPLYLLRPTQEGTARYHDHDMVTSRDSLPMQNEMKSLLGLMVIVLGPIERKSNDGRCHEADDPAHPGHAMTYDP